MAFLGPHGEVEALERQKTGQPERRKSKSLWRVRLPPPPRGFRLNRSAAAAGERIPGAAGAFWSSWGFKTKKMELPTQISVK
jgi:hypothetical protein